MKFHFSLLQLRKRPLKNTIEKCEISKCGSLGTPSDAHDYYVTFQPHFTPSQLCARGQMSPLAPWLRHCLNRHNRLNRQS